METGLERVHGLSAVEPGGDGGAQTLLLDLPCLSLSGVRFGGCGEVGYCQCDAFSWTGIYRL